MTSAILAQLKAHNAAPAAPRPASGPGTRPAAVRPVAVPKQAQHETPKEQPGPRPDTPVRWQLAKGLFAEQFPGCFRLVVSGPADALPAVLAALQPLAP